MLGERVEPHGRQPAGRSWGEGRQARASPTRSPRPGDLAHQTVQITSVTTARLGAVLCVLGPAGHGESLCHPKLQGPQANPSWGEDVSQSPLGARGPGQRRRRLTPSTPPPPAARGGPRPGGPNSLHGDYQLPGSSLDRGGVGGWFQAPPASRVYLIFCQPPASGFRSRFPLSLRPLAGPTRRGEARPGPRCGVWV